MRFKKEFEQCRASLILVEPGDAQMIREFVIFAQTTDDKRGEVGFSTAARTDEKQVVLVIGERAFLDPFYRVLEQFLPLNEDELEVFGIGAAGRENPDGFGIVNPTGWH